MKCRIPPQPTDNWHGQVAERLIAGHISRQAQAGSVQELKGPKEKQGPSHMFTITGLSVKDWFYIESSPCHPASTHNMGMDVSGEVWQGWLNVMKVALWCTLGALSRYAEVLPLWKAPQQTPLCGRTSCSAVTCLFWTLLKPDAGIRHDS